LDTLYLAVLLKIKATIISRRNTDSESRNLLGGGVVVVGFGARNKVFM